MYIHTHTAFKEMIVDTGTRVSDIFVDKDISVHASSQKAYVDFVGSFVRLLARSLEDNR